ncbi:MAG TPA: 16S rRNA (cytosine(1402)-N(4))-methyltransferase RsmH [Verrucomicrobiae bacterium]
MPDFIHKPVMLSEVLAALRLQPGGRVVDGTIGGGGHAAAMLSATAPDGWLFGCDQDGDAVMAARQRLAEFAGRFEIRQANFAELAEWVEPASCDAVLLDLGIGTHQLDAAGRGFSFQQDGPLDMRKDRRQALTAAELVNSASEAELAKIFWELGQEQHARRIARAVVQERQSRLFETTRQLAQLVERMSPRHGRKAHPATKVFQALRIRVNDELATLKSGLAAAYSVLKPPGRLAAITFHSLEDRIVKEFGREQTRDYTVAGDVDVPELRQSCAPKMRWVQRKAIRPGAAELESNPRARSGQLRVLEKI